MKALFIKKQYLIDAFCFFVGSIIFAVSVNTFTAPNNIAPGGLTGVATMVNYLTGGQLPIGITIILLNIPIFIWAFLSNGFRYVAKTACATVISSLAIDLTAGFLPKYNGDMLLTTAFGGLLSGVGLALILIRGATTGGTDMIADLLHKHVRHFSMGRLILMTDLVIVILSAVVYQSFESPLYAAIVIFIMSKVIDSVLYGVNSGTGKTMFIISQKNEQIAQRIIEDLDRGVTELKARGCYSKQDSTVLLCAVRRQEVHKTYDIIHSLDRDAFIIVGEAGEITGEGFHEVISPTTRKRLPKGQKDQ